jgi:hypothetical protein
VVLSERAGSARASSQDKRATPADSSLATAGNPAAAATDRNPAAAASQDERTELEEMSTVPQYTGDSQQSQINTANPVPSPEAGPSVMPPNPYVPDTAQTWLPPPLKQTDVYLAMQTWPL